MLCRGLHCAGCGRGIPASLVVVGALIGLAHTVSSAAVAAALYWLAGSIAVTGISIAVMVTRLHKSPLQGCVVWDDSLMMSELVQGAERFPSIVRTGQSVPILAPSWPHYPMGGVTVWQNELPPRSSSECSE